jgi:hypothetical protein
MIGHVASTGEARGRVVLRLSCGLPAHDAALEAAARIARAFDSEIEGLFVEDRQLFDLSGYSFAREISLTGRVSRALSAKDIEQELQAAFFSIRRRMEAAAKRYNMRVYTTRVRDEPMEALARACASAGPWNVIVMGEPFAPHDGRLLGEILARVRDATGLVTIGPRTRRTSGPVVVAVEDPEHVVSMMRTAERLVGGDAGRREVLVMLIADDPDALHWLEGQTRLLLAHQSPPQFILAPPAHGEPATVAETIRRAKAGFVVARFGGLTVPADDLRPLASALESPLFLVR